MSDRVGTMGMVGRRDISGNSARTARKSPLICSFWERLASAKSSVWSQLARICRQGRDDKLDMLGRLGRLTVWLGRLGGVKAAGASQMSHLILPFARRRLASDLVSYDPFGQLHIESFMGWKEGGEKGKSWNVKNLNGAATSRVFAKLSSFISLEGGAKKSHLPPRCQSRTS